MSFKEVGAAKALPGFDIRNFFSVFERENAFVLVWVQRGFNLFCSVGHVIGYVQGKHPVLGQRIQSKK